MSTDKRSVASILSTAGMIAAAAGVIAFAGWLASTSSAGVFGGIVLFIFGVVVGVCAIALVVAAIDSLVKGEWLEPADRTGTTTSGSTRNGISQRHLGTCPHCGKRSLGRTLPGSCDACGSNLWVEQYDASTPRQDVLKYQNPVATYDWAKRERRWRLLFTAEQVNQAKRNAVLAERRALDAERRRMASRPSKPVARLIRKASEAEDLCAEWVRWMGFPGAAVTPPGADGGIDILGPGNSGSIAAQVKFEAVSAGRPKLQELYGAAVAAGATKTAFFSSAGFTAQAKIWANQVGMALFEFALDGSVVPANEHGERLFKG